MKIILVLFFFIFSAFTSSQALAGISDFCVHNPSSPQCRQQASNTTQQINAEVHVGNTTVPNILAKGSVAPNTNTLFSFRNQVMETAVTMASRFIPYAKGLATLLGVIAFIWLGIMIMLSQADIWHMGLRPLFMLIMKVGFTFWFLSDYSYLTSAVEDGFQFAANILTGASAGASNGSTIASVASVLFHDVTTMFSLMGQLIDKMTPTGNIFSMIGEFFVNIGNVVIDEFAISVSIAIAIIIFVLFLVLYLVYQIVIAIAIAVGPVFIPFLILPETKGLFDGWVKMLIMGGIYLMTSTVIVGLVGTAMVTYTQELNSTLTGAGWVLNYGTYLELVILEIVSIGALLKTHEFAHAIGGSVSIGGINPGGAIVKAAKGAAGLK